MNLRELNYILIPRPETVARWEGGRAGRLARPLLWFWRSLTPEGVILSVAVLIAGMAGIDVRFSHLYLVFCSLFALLVTAFIARPLACLRDLSFHIEHPPRVSSGEVVTFALVLKNEGSRPLFALRILRPFLPWDGSWESPPASVPLLEPGAEARVYVSARFLCRGRRLIGRFSVASVRPLGLVRGPRVDSRPAVLTILPRICRVARLSLPSRASYQPGGVVQSAASGESFELLGLREYRPGDRLRDLHARSWARLGRPMVREYRQEFFRRAAVLLHCQARRASRDLFDAAVELTAGLIARLVRDDVLVDLLLLSDQPVSTTLGCHVSVLEEALDLLAAVQPSSKQLSPMAIPLLDPYQERLSTVFCVLLDWDEERASLIEALQGRGLDIKVCLVGGSRGRVADRARRAGVRLLEPHLVRREEPLVL